MSLVSASIVGGLLFAFLALVWLKGASAARGLSSRSDVPLADGRETVAPCPSEFVPRIFSCQDLTLVSNTHSRQLVRLFRRERKAVALMWVQETSAAIQRIMREHVRVSRSSADLEFRTEMRLFFFYGQLIFVCGVLFLAIQTVGPVWLQSLAVYAEGLAQRITQTQESFKAGVSARQLSNAESS
jgi:hypothetical protein